MALCASAVAEAGQPLLVAEQREPVAVGVVVAAELPEQIRRLVSGAWARRGSSLRSRSAMASEATRPSTRPTLFGDRLVAVVLLHPGGGGIQHGILAFPEDDLAHHGQGQGVAPAPLSMNRRIESAASPRLFVSLLRRLSRSASLALQVSSLSQFSPVAQSSKRDKVRLALAHLENMAANRPATPSRRRGCLPIPADSRPAGACIRAGPGQSPGRRPSGRVPWP